MLNKFKKKISKNTEIIDLGLLLITTVLSTTYYNFSKEKIYNNYKPSLIMSILRNQLITFLKILSQSSKKLFIEFKKVKLLITF